MDKPLKPEVIVNSFEEKDIHELIEKLNDISQAFGPDQLIILQIDSFGGAAYGLIMLYEHIKTLPNPIATYTNSKAMSAGAFLLAMAGRPGMRFASPNSTIMVHEIQCGAFGDMKDMEAQMESLSVLNERVLAIFAKSIGLTRASEVRDMIRAYSSGHDLTLTAHQAKELKIVDEVGYLRLKPEVRFDLHVQIEPMRGAKIKAKAKRKVKAKGN